MIFQRPVEIDDGPIMDNFRGDGLVRVYNPDHEFEVRLSRRDIDFLDHDFAQAISFFGQDLAREIPPFYFPEAAVLKAKAAADWQPPQLGIIWPETRADQPIRLVMRRQGEEWPDRYIYFDNKQSLDNFRLMLGYMKHQDSRTLVSGSPNSSGISAEVAGCSVPKAETLKQPEPMSLFQQVEQILDKLGEQGNGAE